MSAKRRDVVRLLDEEPELGHDLDAGSAHAARRAVVAPVELLPPGRWQPQEPSPPSAAMLILDGFMTRSVIIDGLGCAELLGRGDLLDPWPSREGVPSVPEAVEWHVLEPARLAVLDARVLAAMAVQAKVQQQAPGYVFRLMDGLDAHHDVARFRWELVPESGGEPIAIGFDVAVADGSGRIASVVGFLDKAPDA